MTQCWPAALLIVAAAACAAGSREDDAFVCGTGVRKEECLVRAKRQCSDGKRKGCPRLEVFNLVDILTVPMVTVEIT